MRPPASCCRHDRTWSRGQISQKRADLPTLWGLGAVFGVRNIACNGCLEFVGVLWSLRQKLTFQTMLRIFTLAHVLQCRLTGRGPSVCEVLLYPSTVVHTTYSTIDTTYNAHLYIQIYEPTILIYYLSLWCQSGSGYKPPGLISSQV